MADQDIRVSYEAMKDGRRFMMKVSKELAELKHFMSKVMKVLFVEEGVEFVREIQGKRWCVMMTFWWSATGTKGIRNR